MGNMRFRLVLILAVIVFFTWRLVPPSQTINLGLDLRGGTHMVLQVPGKEVLDAEVDQGREVIEANLREKGIQAAVTRGEGLTIIVEGVGAEQQREVENELEAFSGVYAYKASSRDGVRSYILEMRPGQQDRIRAQAVNQARTVISRRVDQYGVAEPTITVYGSGAVQDQIIVELPGVDDFQRVEDIIRSTGKLEFRLVDPKNSQLFDSERAALAAFNDLLPTENEILAHRGGGHLVVRRAAVISGEHLKPGSVRVISDPYTGQPEVGFSLNSDGAARFSKTTREHRNDFLAIVLDGRIYSYPRIESEIRESGVITGLDSLEEAQDLSLTLRSGALPAKPIILESRNIGPSLGRESIRNGLTASLVGMLLVVSAMLVIYRLSGINAILCLVINLVILLGVLASVKATLTLPGIAGIILTIGMAVDANILIFERIKEELRAGKTVRSAVDAAFKRVFLTIIDTNVTTLVAALFLFQFGTGPIQGFAVTLAVGLLANIFTAVFVSRTFFSLLLQNRETARLSI